MRCLFLSTLNDLYDIGAIELTSDPDIGVSCDGIARMHVNEIVVIGTVEYKTRLALLSTIEQAENAVRAHGRHVICNYGDEGVSKFSVTCNHISHASSLYYLFAYLAFKACVPAGNRNQLRHQVLVTGLDWCLFVTSKLVN